MIVKRRVNSFVSVLYSMKNTIKFFYREKKFGNKFKLTFVKFVITFVKLIFKNLYYTRRPANKILIKKNKKYHVRLNIVIILILIFRLQFFSYSKFLFQLFFFLTLFRNNVSDNYTINTLGLFIYTSSACFFFLFYFF